jgi:hypothetical protein
MKPVVDFGGIFGPSNSIQVDKEGNLVSLPPEIIEQIANRVIEKLKAYGSLNPDPRLWGGDPHSL